MDHFVQVGGSLARYLRAFFAKERSLYMNLPPGTRSRFR